MTGDKIIIVNGKVGSNNHLYDICYYPSSQDVSYKLDADGVLHYKDAKRAPNRFSYYIAMSYKNCIIPHRYHMVRWFCGLGAQYFLKIMDLYGISVECSQSSAFILFKEDADYAKFIMYFGEHDLDN